MNVVDRDVCNRMPTSLLIQELCNMYMYKDGDIDQYHISRPLIILLNLTMTALNPGDPYPSFVVIHAGSEVVPLSFPLRNDGQLRVSSLRLNLRFGLSEDFMFLDKEVYDT
jgi:hypothetical protein